MVQKKLSEGETSRSHNAKPITELIN